MKSGILSSKNICRVLGVCVLGLGYLPTLFWLSEKGSESQELRTVAQNDVADTLIKTLKTENVLASISNERESTENIVSNIANIVPVQSEQVEQIQKPHTETNEKIVAKISNIKTIKSGKFANSKVVNGTVKCNFYVDARHAGVPAKVVDSIISNLSGKINFRKSIKQGNKFKVVFDQKKRLVYCAIEAGRENRIKASIYGVEENGKMVYYHENGVKIHQARNNHFGRPLPSMVVTSPFGMRRHPVTGAYRYHSGVDLKANHGTPIRAIFDGVVVRASRYSGYGNCVQIAHSSGYKSLYGHLSGYAVKNGARVKKGQVIGYAGSTGVSTGPHLHLELARYDKTINPLSVKMLPMASERCNAKFFKKYKQQMENAIRQAR